MKIKEYLHIITSHKYAILNLRHDLSKLDEELSKAERL